VDSGENWTQVLSLNNIIYDIEVSNGSIYAAIGFKCPQSWYGLIKSTNHGSNWSEIHNGLTVDASEKLALEDEDNVWIGGEMAVYKSTNGGSSFADKSNMNSVRQYTYGLTVNSNGMFCTNYDSWIPRISYSTDNGSSWFNVIANCQYPPLQGTRITTDPSDPDIMHSTHFWLVEGIAVVYKTSTAGQNWTPIYNNFMDDPPSPGAELWDIAGDPNNHDIIFISGSAIYRYTVYRSTNRGDTYNQVHQLFGSGGVALSVAIDKHTQSNGISQHIYTGGGKTLGGTVNLWRSTNGGNNWPIQPYNDGLSDVDIWALAVSERTDEEGYYIFAGKTDGLYRKHNTSDEWELASSGIYYNMVSTIVTHPTEANIAHAGVNDESNTGHIYVSTNFGNSWSLESEGFPSARINQLAIYNDPINGPRLFAATSVGIYEARESSSLASGIEKSITVKNYPNPFNSETTIQFDVPVKVRVEVKMYDLLGREVRQVADATFDKGIHLLKLNAENLATGIYFLALRINNQSTLYKKIGLVK
jgi:photosystem II stability/assembly factor-like uncharacterized protein